jgi:hypothetical protein
MRPTRSVLLALAVTTAVLGQGTWAQAGGAPPAGSAAVTATAKAGAPQWHGNRPGKLYLGMSCGRVCGQKAAALGHSYGVHRQFEGWGNWSRLAADIRSDHSAGRLPWVSFKPPRHGAVGWRAIAGGRYDGRLRGLASMLKANDAKPVLLTFNHEPSNDGPESSGALWARAYCHIHDLLKRQGALVNVADPPILGDWLFNGSNKSQSPGNWVTRGVLSRAPFLGVDLYQNSGGGTFAKRIPLIKRWMAARGFPHKMIGIGEMGSTGAYRGSAARWLRLSLGWAVQHTSQVGVISYFNSSVNSRAHVYWPLNESRLKMSVYRSFLRYDRVIS